MATAITNYYCHKCHIYFPHLINSQCPKCREEFVEEAPTMDFQSNNSQRNQFDRPIRNPFAGRRGTTIADGSIFLHGPIDDDDDEQEEENHRYTSQRRDEELNETNHHVETNPFLNHFLHHILNENFHRIQQRNSTPTPNDFHQLFFQFASQLQMQDDEGVAPATQNQIDSIVNVQINSQQIHDKLQCSICMEEFHLDEQVKRLTCSHHFHEKCISTWLRLHGTCPTCRVNIHQSSQQTSSYPFGAFRRRR